jgi:hypothetical protein
MQKLADVFDHVGAVTFIPDAPKLFSEPQTCLNDFVVVSFQTSFLYRIR